jgi:hypothetical protein
MTAVQKEEENERRRWLRSQLQMKETKKRKMKKQEMRKQWWYI